MVLQKHPFSCTCALTLLLYCKRRTYGVMLSSVSQRRMSTANKHDRKIDYYNILRISPNASFSQIKTAYYRLSLIYHPDKNNGSAESRDKFAAVSEAYQVLADEKKRVTYDRTLARQSRVHQNFTKDVAIRHRKRNLAYKYDYDEWTRAHYGTVFNRNQRLSQDRIELLRKLKQAGGRKLIFNRVIQITVLLVAFFSGYLFNFRM